MDPAIDTNRHHPNTYKGQEQLVRPPETFRQQIQQQANRLLSFFEKKLASEGYPKGDYTVYTGCTGIALMYWQVAKLMGMADYKQKALNILEAVIPQLKGKRSSFLGGDGGPLAVAAVLYHETGKQKKRDEMIKKLIDLSGDVTDTCDPTTSNELLFGRAGYMYALLFVNKHAASDGEKLIDAELLEKIAGVIIQEGLRSGQPLLYYEWHDKCYLGAGHGILGIIHILLLTPDSLKQKDLDFIRKTLDWLLTLRFPSGNIPSSLESRGNDRLVHWCHGASGAIWTWFLANKIFYDERYLAAARQCAEVIWDRGLLRKGYSVCHGVAGSTYGLMAAYEFTKEPKYMEQAHLFTHWCFSYGAHADHPPDRPLSLFEGLAGVLYMLLGFGWGDAPGFPAYSL